jgi:hypothetical protein
MERDKATDVLSTKSTSGADPTGRETMARQFATSIDPTGRAAMVRQFSTNKDAPTISEAA